MLWHEINDIVTLQLPGTAQQRTHPIYIRSIRSPNECRLAFPKFQLLRLPLAMSAGGGSRYEVGVGLRQIPARAESCLEIPSDVFADSSYTVGSSSEMRSIVSARVWPRSTLSGTIKFQVTQISLATARGHMRGQLARVLLENSKDMCRTSFPAKLSMRSWEDAHSTHHEILCVFLRASWTNSSAKVQRIPRCKRRKVPRQSVFGTSKPNAVHRCSSRF